MGSVALEAFFGSPESVGRLGTALKQVSTGVGEVRTTLDAQVTGLVPARWRGTAASAFSNRWHQDSVGAESLAQQASLVSDVMVALSSELRSAKSLFQRAEQQAMANRCWITPFFIVLPDSWMDPGAVAAVAWIQPEVTAAVAMAEAARLKAQAELAAIAMAPGAWSIFKEFADGLAEGVGELIGLAELGVRVSPFRAMVDPRGWLDDTERFGAGLWQSIQHPGEILKKMVDYDDWASGHYARAVGKLTPMAIITVLTAGSGAAADAGVAGTEAVAEAAATTTAKEVAVEAAATTVTREAAVDAATTTAGREVSELAGWSARDVNPGFPGAGRTMNCANCAIATDSTLKGFPAAAMPGSATPISELETMFGNKFVPMANGQADIEAAMQTAGPGAKGIVFGWNGPGQVGHVFNVANQGGAINFVDGQIGGAGAGSFAHFQRWFLLRTN